MSIRALPISSESFAPKSPFVTADPVLVIARGSALQKILRRTVSMIGHHAEVVPDGLTALEVLRRKAFSAVIFDLAYPAALQRDLCVKIIALMSGLPVMVLSASPNAADRILFLQVGADDYVSLPFSPRALATRLDRLIRPAWGSKRKESAAYHFSSECFSTATFLIAATSTHPSPGRLLPDANQGNSPPLEVNAEELVPDGRR